MIKTLDMAIAVFSPLITWPGIYDGQSHRSVTQVIDKLNLYVEQCKKFFNAKKWHDNRVGRSINERFTPSMDGGGGEGFIFGHKSL